MFWELYLFSIIDSVKQSLGMFGALLGMAFIVSVAAGLPIHDPKVGCTDSTKAMHKLLVKTCLISSITLTIINTALPNQKGVAMIIGGTAAYSAIQSPEAKEIGGKALLLLNQKLDESLKVEPSKDK